jgi:hypothetical protein
MAKSDVELKELNRLLGNWITEATHPAMPGVVVHGTAVIEWLAGEKFLIERRHNDRPEFPDSISIIGFADQDRVGEDKKIGESPGGMTMSYFDSRGVARVYESSIDGKAWKTWRNAKGFSQRFTGTFADGGNTIVGQSELCQDDVHWADDLKITYRRRS